MEIDSENILCPYCKNICGNYSVCRECGVLVVRHNVEVKNTGVKNGD